MVERLKHEVFISEKAIDILHGVLNENLKFLRGLFNVEVTARGNRIVVEGEERDCFALEDFLNQISELLDEGISLDKGDFTTGARAVKEERDTSLRELLVESRVITTGSKNVVPKSINQKRYIHSLQEHDMVFGIGPAGTGKTYLAVTVAVSALLKERIKRIILARPAVEAGEKLGFLPGDMIQKVDPYLRPLYDAMYDLMEPDRTNDLIQKGIIEIAPIAFMRGRTLNDSFVILDEAQNTTSEQMKMFLTRIGFNSRAVITGDITQIDLASRSKSGLVEVQRILSGIKGIDFIYFDERDVVRHTLVQSIIQAYEKHDRKHKS